MNGHSLWQGPYGRPPVAVLLSLAAACGGVPLAPTASGSVTYALESVGGTPLPTVLATTGTQVVRLGLADSLILADAAAASTEVRRVQQWRVSVGTPSERDSTVRTTGTARRVGTDTLAITLPGQAPPLLEYARSADGQTLTVRTFGCRSATDCGGGLPSVYRRVRP